jgi:hypothetical protein
MGSSSSAYSSANYGYTQPVSNAMRGTPASDGNAGGHAIGNPCVPAGASSPRGQRVPDMRPRIQDMRRAQKIGLLPDPHPGKDRHLLELRNPPEIVHRPGSSTFLFVGASASAPHQSRADDEEVNGQSRLRNPASCHANPRAQDLFNWLKEDKDPRFSMSLSPLFQQGSLPPLEGTMIILGVRKNSERFAGGVQELVDKINAIPCTNIPVVVLDLPVPGGSVNPKGVIRRAVDLEGCVTEAQIEALRQNVYVAIAEVQQSLGFSGAKPHQSPIPGNLDGQAFVDFYTTWAKRVTDAEVRGKILAHIQTYAGAKQAYAEIQRKQSSEYIKVLSTQLKDKGTPHSVTIIPLAEPLYNILQMGSDNAWCKLLERERFKGTPY